MEALTITQRQVATVCVFDCMLMLYQPGSLSVCVYVCLYFSVLIG